MSKAFFIEMRSWPVSTAPLDDLPGSGIESSLLLNAENIEAAALFIKDGFRMDVLIVDINPSLPMVALFVVASSAAPSLFDECFAIDFALLR